jgi:alkylation response protein AidB-like acyl-CoA dehydrogenase
MSGDIVVPSFDDNHRAIRQRARSIARTCLAAEAADVDRHATFPERGFRALFGDGLHALHIPAEYSGPGADVLAGIIVMEEIAWGCAATSLIPSVTRLATMPILMHGTAELRKRYLPPVARDGAIFAFALSEPDAGSDVAAISTRAVRCDGHYVINGTKRWITNASVAEYFLLFAVTGPGDGSRSISAFVLHRDDPGITIGKPEEKLGLRGSPTCEIYLRDVQVPFNRMVGEPGAGLAMALEALDHSRVFIAAQAVGIAQAALDRAITHLRSRRQFGRTLDEFQGLKFMVAQMGMNVAAARELTYAAAVRAEDKSDDLGFYAAAAKCFASDVAMRVTTDAVQLLGGMGYVRSGQVERMMRDAKATQIYEGTNQIQQLVMARHLLSQDAEPGESSDRELTTD